MEPIEYLRALRSKWFVVVAAGLVGVLATWLLTPERPVQARQSGIAQYNATHTLIQEEAGSDGRSVDLNRAALLTRTGEVPRRVVEKLGLNVSPPVLATSVTVETDSNVRTLTITVADPDGPTAALLANTFAAETVAYLDERERARQQRLLDIANARADALQRQSIELQAQIPTLRADRQALAQAQYDAVVRQFGLAYEQAQAIAAQDPTLSGLVTLEEAVPIGVVQGGIRAPSSRSGRILIIGPVALLLGIGLALLLYRLDTRIRTKEDAEEAFGLPVVTEVPLLPWRTRRHHVVPGPESGAPTVAEAFRTLRSSVRFMTPCTLAPDGGGPRSTGVGLPARVGAKGAQVLLVTSPGAGEGKTSVVCNLAASFARAGHSVLIIDFDLQYADSENWLEVVGPARRVQASDRLVPIAELARRTSIPGVRVVADWATGDATEAVELGASLVTSARSAAEVVILDTPGLLVASDASELVSSADAVVLVCKAGGTSSATARRTAEVLGRFRASVLGVVLVGVRPQRRLARLQRDRLRPVPPSSGDASPPSSVASSAPSGPPPPPIPERSTRAAASALPPSAPSVPAVPPAPIPERSTRAAAGALSPPVPTRLNGASRPEPPAVPAPRSETPGAAPLLPSPASTPAAASLHPAAAALRRSGAATPAIATDAPAVAATTPLPAPPSVAAAGPGGAPVPRPTDPVASPPVDAKPPAIPGARPPVAVAPRAASAAATPAGGPPAPPRWPRPANPASSRSGFAREWSVLMTAAMRTLRRGR